MRMWSYVFVGALLLNGEMTFARGEFGMLSGVVRDADTGRCTPARLYVNDADGQPRLPETAPDAQISVYDKLDGGTGIREAYMMVGPAPWEVRLPAGRYEVTIERGKEYRPLTRSVRIEDGRTTREAFRIERAFDMAEKGWYSADCHVHTPLADLARAQLADDVNVTFPITAWATRDDQVPAGDPPASVPSRGELVEIDETHAYWNLNTEYEIFHVGSESHTLGAFMILGHDRPFDRTAPPVRPIAEEARRQGAILDWEKHSWPWSTMLVPVAGIDVAELSNNSMWRQRTIDAFLWGRQPPDWLGEPMTTRRFIEYGLQSYYMMLNCGYPLRPSAGSANGVHPVPLGHSRVYVRIDGPFTYAKWLDAFRRGRSFATNGPMLLMTVDGREPGDRARLEPGAKREVGVRLEVLSTGDVEVIELIANGRVVRVETQRRDDAKRGTSQHHEMSLPVSGTTWIAARCFEQPDSENPRFAHTGVVVFEDPSAPLRPAVREQAYLIADVEAQIARNRGTLSDEALAEFEEAQEAYRRLEPSREQPTPEVAR